MMVRLLFVLICACTWVRAAEVVTDESVFAVITHRGGVAKRLAHNHFIYATGYNATLGGDWSQPESITLDLGLEVKKLKLDDGSSKPWLARLKALGIVEEAFSEQPEDRLQKIRKAMLGKKQLNATKHPRITAKIKSVSPQSKKVGDHQFALNIMVEVTITGKTHVVTCAADLTQEGDAWRLEATGSANFSDFGIEPYSAAFGAIANKDTFYIYVNLKAR